MGEIRELSGHYYDCAMRKQAYRHVTTTKDILEHVGRTYVSGGDIWATMDGEKLFLILKPVDAEDNLSDITTTTGKVTKTEREQVNNKIFEQ